MGHKRMMKKFMIDIGKNPILASPSNYKENESSISFINPWTTFHEK
jgi:hypothetical protein